MIERKNLYLPGFSFILARRTLLEQCEGNAHSHSLDAYDQWKTMDGSGKWRFTSPTHTVRAFQQALAELEEEGGVEARYQRYKENQRILREGMERLGYHTLLPRHGYRFELYLLLQQQRQSAELYLRHSDYTGACQYGSLLLCAFRDGQQRAEETGP